jgi:peptide/nickel transport system ATP-binding protein
MLVLPHICQGGWILIKVTHLKKWFPLSEGLVASLISRGEKKSLKAVDDVSFSIESGEILGLAGESGCGKTTVGMTLINLYEPTSGSILFNGRDVAYLTGDDLRKFRREVQIIFQNPYESLNPRFTIFDTIIEPLNIYRIGTSGERKEKVIQTLEMVGLKPVNDYIHKFPHELSGGQRQRVAIARGIVLDPRFVVADEPVSMLDVSIRAGVLNLLKSFNKSTGLSLLYISHDLSTIRYMCQRTAIMYLGKIVEIGPTEEIINNPKHPYTSALISAVPLTDPQLDRQRIHLPGELPNPVDLPEGCRFRPRCKKMMDCCKQEEPRLQEQAPDHYVACYL